MNVDPLTPRQYEIVDLLARGFGNKEVARRLGISERTVQTHITNIFCKTGLRTRTEIAVWVVVRGIVDGQEAVKTIESRIR